MSDLGNGDIIGRIDFEAAVMTRPKITAVKKARLIQAGFDRFGYFPNDGNGKTSSIFGKCVTAFRAHRAAVKAAKENPLDGDWRVTRDVLDVLSKAGIRVHKP